ncbi:RNA-binding protein cabeza-like [Selaginella moellendorffii]|uniref:RNA-binding protein cabeza-like n=1 Tax=Selaginella moellendorffii TaxID=88036 RepID=UPI000D1D02AF|nr:RNA-binding protein cabeza-like [Selaginella moellendorffii]|eukprot:XP_024529802.1 RNA-binding protein cabeza-like [Selaginella moellendorffii]
MLRLSRFRGRRCVLGARAGLDWWNASGNASTNSPGSCCGLEERYGWSDDIGSAPLIRQQQERGICGFASENGWHSSSRRENWGRGGWARTQYRGYADEPPGGDDEEAGTGGGRDERDVILDLIEKDMSIQDDVALYLYSKVRELDPKTLLGAMYLKAGYQAPRYSVSAGYKNKFVGTVVIRGKRFASSPCETQDEAEKSAADSALSWVLGQPRQGGAAGDTQGRGRGRGAGGIRGGMRGGGRGRGRGRGGGNVKKRGTAQRVAIKPRKCFHVEINYKLMSFVVLYDDPQEVYYPYKDFPTQRDLDAIARRPSF